MKAQLKELVSLIGGYAFKSELYKDSGIRVIRIANVQDGFISDEYPCFYPTSYKDEIGQANLQENDLLMSLTGNVGRVAFLKKNLLPAALNQRVECLRTNDVLMKKYLYYFFRSKKFIDDAYKNSSGIAQLNMSTKWLGEYSITLYSEDEMVMICNELELINNLIDAKKDELGYFDELIKSRFIEMFGDINSCNNKIDLELLCEKITDGSHNPPKGVDISTYLMISSQNIHDDKIDYKDVRFLSEDDFVKEDKRTNIRVGDVLLTIVGAIGRSAVVEEQKSFTCQRSVCVIHPKKDEVNSIFLKHMLDCIITQIESEARGIAQKGIYLNQVKKLQVIKPTLEIQNEFAKFVKLIDKSKFVYHSRYFLWLIFTLKSSTIAYSSVVSIFA